MTSSDNTNRNYTIFCYVVSLFYLSNVFFTHLYDPPLSPDSWSYFELSKHIFSDFYKVNTWRQYQYIQPYGVSFPPLWPIIISIANMILNVGIYAGYFANLLISIVTLLFLISLSRNLLKQPLYGFLFYSFLLLNDDYINELVAARSIPLQILFIVATLNIFFSKNRISNKNIIIISGLAALIALTRFDFILSGIALGIPVMFYASNKKLLAGLLYYFCYFIVLSPWMYYSYRYFGKLFVSDNTQVVLSLIPTHVMEYHFIPIQTLFDDVYIWLQKQFQFALGLVINLIKTVISNFLITMVTCIIILQVSKSFLVEDAEKNNKYGKILIYNSDFLRLLFIGASVILPQIFAISLTGYPDTRYFTFITLYIFITLVFVHHHFMQGNTKYIQEISFLTKYGMLFLFLTLILIFPKPDKISIELNKTNIYDKSYDDIISCLAPNPQSKGILFVDTVNIFKFGAQTGIRTFTIPRNFKYLNINKDKELKALIKKFGVTHIYAKLNSIINNKYFTPVENCSLPIFRVSG